WKDPAMHVTFAELSGLAPVGYSPVPWLWPTERETQPDEAARWIRAAGALANIPGGTLVGARVGLVTTRPEDFVLACLLRCHGAWGRFLCPDPVEWEEDVHGPLFRELLQQLAGHDSLDFSPLQSGNQTLAELGKPAPAESFDRLIALVPADGKAAPF